MKHQPPAGSSRSGFNFAFEPGSLKFEYYNVALANAEKATETAVAAAKKAGFDGMGRHVNNYPTTRSRRFISNRVKFVPLEKHPSMVDAQVLAKLPQSCPNRLDLTVELPSKPTTEDLGAVDVRDPDVAVAIYPDVIWLYGSVSSFVSPRRVW